jgi:hypothetical protein
MLSMISNNNRMRKETGNEAKRLPRKLKKQIKKDGFYEYGISWVHCLICQKKRNGFGYNQYFCEDC